MAQQPDHGTRQLLAAIRQSADALPSDERRRFLRKVLTAGAGAFVGAAFTGLPTDRSRGRATTAATQYPPGVPPWPRTLGADVDTNLYGMPSKFEKDVIRRIVAWLTPTP